MIRLIVVIILVALVSISQNGYAQQNTSSSHLASCEIGPCEDQFDHYEEKILSYDSRYELDTLIVDIRLNAACCLKLDISEEKKNGDTLRLNLTRTGEPCDCYCIYPIKLEITSLSSEPLKHVYLDNHSMVLKQK